MALLITLRRSDLLSVHFFWHSRLSRDLILLYVFSATIHTHLELSKRNTRAPRIANISIAFPFVIYKPTRQLLKGLILNLFRFLRRSRCLTWRLATDFKMAVNRSGQRESERNTSSNGNESAQTKRVGLNVPQL